MRSASLVAGQETKDAKHIQHAWKHYLEKLNSNHSKHELQDVHDQHYIANSLNGNDHAFHYRLGGREERKTKIERERNTERLGYHVCICYST